MPQQAQPPCTDFAQLQGGSGSLAASSLLGYAAAVVREAPAPAISTPSGVQQGPQGGDAPPRWEGYTPGGFASLQRLPAGQHGQQLTSLGAEQLRGGTLRDMGSSYQLLPAAASSGGVGSTACVLVPGATLLEPPGLSEPQVGQLLHAGLHSQCVAVGSSRNSGLWPAGAGAAYTALLAQLDVSQQAPMLPQQAPMLSQQAPTLPQLSDQEQQGTAVLAAPPVVWQQQTSSGGQQLDRSALPGLGLDGTSTSGQ